MNVLNPNVKNKSNIGKIKANTEGLVLKKNSNIAIFSGKYFKGSLKGSLAKQ